MVVQQKESIEFKRWLMECCTTPLECSRMLFRTLCSAASRLRISARAGIRTRVSGMKTRDDGPGYTTRANDIPCHLLFITIGHCTLLFQQHPCIPWNLASESCQSTEVHPIPNESQNSGFTARHDRQDRPWSPERTTLSCSRSAYVQ